MRQIEVLGSGCSKCKVLAERTDAAARSLGIEYNLVKITEFPQIMARGVLSTPALVVDGVVKLQGQVPTEAAIAELLKG